MPDSSDDNSDCICVNWTPSTDGFLEFVESFREITSSGLFKRKKCNWTDKIVKRSLDISLGESLSILPQRLSLSNFKLGLPITSFGCILRWIAPQGTFYLLIKRKESMSYIDLIHGNYRESQLFFILQELTIEERERILENDFDTLWEDLHLRPPEGENYRYGLEIFTALRPFLPQLFDKVAPSYQNDKHLWLWPKGRINWKREENGDIFPESPIECALREFEEETNGIDLLGLNSRLLYSDPIVEKFLGSNSKNYRTNYFVFENEGPLPELTQFEQVNTEIRSVSTGEIEEMRWVSVEQVGEKLREQRCRVIDWIEKNPSDGVASVNRAWTLPINVTECDLDAE